MPPSMRHDFVADDEIFATGFYRHALPDPQPKAVRRRRAIHAATPDLLTGPLEVLANGDRAVVRVRLPNCATSEYRAIRPR